MFLSRTLCSSFLIAYLNKTLAPLEVSQRRKRKFTRASKGPTFSVDFFTLCGFFNRHFAAALAFRSGGALRRWNYADVLPGFIEV